METLPEVLARLGGQATFAELTRLVPKRELAARVESGVIRRVALGIYGLPGQPADEQAAVAYDGVVSHTSAALAWKLPLLKAPEKPHITLPAKRHPRPGPPAVLHWASIADEDRSNRLTSMLRTVTDCLRILPFDEALAVADSSLGKGITRRELLAATTAMRGPGSGRARKVAALATAGGESFLESMLRALLIQARIEGFETQVVVERGWVRARVDLGHRELKIALEAEGYEFHGSSKTFAEDCRRYDELVAAGWLVLRFTYQQVLFESEWVIEVVRQLIVSRSTGGTADSVARRSGAERGRRRKG
ncbi:type IV toxin-antitoxin system AbiEi family antitoxin domain-containing protein [Kribbella sp. NPDC051718]|uniref:type IV toxin-antitoxin system AbiEi family antitoxin domain-containing protein n=1 Tax=Kribbella sp. NPDC051718 TaxID=3155168 RepID=UPI0034320D7F